MPKYNVQHTPVLHGGKGDKTATRYGIGEEIELTVQEAATLGDNVKAVAAAPTDIEAMTVEELKEEISGFKPVEELKGLKKAEMAEILKAHRMAEGA
jgi:hypothetical protein